MNRADQKFIISTITRAGIAENLNDHLDDLGLGRPLSPDDERLGDDICESYAFELGELPEGRDLGDDDPDEVLASINEEFLVRLQIPVV